MAVCNYFLQGRCRYGDKCWNEHPRGGRNQTGRGGGGSVNRVWVNPSQRPGGGVVQPSSFSHGGVDWGRGSSGAGRDDRSSNFNFNAQNRFSALSNTQSGYGRTGGGGGGGGGGGDDASQQLEVIQNDMEVWQSSGQWIFSCYSVLNASITGFVELSPEELRMEYYSSRATGDIRSYVDSVQQLANRWRSRVQDLRAMNANTRTAMVAELNDPRAQTSSGGGIFSSSSSSTSGFGSSSSTSGFGSSTTGFAAPSSASGFAAPSSASGFAAPSSASGFAAPSSASGFGSSGSGFAAGGFGSSGQGSAAGFSFSASSPGFGSSTSQPASCQFGSPAPSASTFSFADPAGATASKSSAAGFSFSSTSAGGFGGSAAAAPGAGGFGGAASVSGSAEDKKSGADDLYTPQSELTADELREFTAQRFTLGQVPLKPPPAELLAV